MNAPATAHDELSAAIREARAELERRPALGALQVTVGSIDLLGWLRTRSPGHRWYFADRDGGAFAADGIAATAPLVELAAQPGERWWIRGDFEGVGQAVLPALELRSEDDKTRVTVRRPVVGAAEPILEFQPGHDPDLEGWHTQLRIVRDAIAAGDVQKVVLSRRTGLTLLDAPNPLDALCRMETDAPETFRFLIDREGGTFFGASPERLIQIDGPLIQSEALAGTRPRGATPASDAALARELLEGPKERAEQAFVEADIRARLNHLCGPVDRGSVEVAQFRHVQHLRTRIRARRPAHVSPAALVNCLHPTPAVCGAPRNAARALIKSLESQPRAGYAAPIGWLTDTHAEVAVALRCAWVQGRQAVLFAGAGLVEGSDPDSEWDELNHKLRPMREALSGR